MKTTRLLLYPLVIIFSVLAGCSLITRTTEFGLSVAISDKIKADCVASDPNIIDLDNPISKDDIIVERILTGNFHDEGDCLVVLTISNEIAENLPHAAGYAHYYFVIMDSSLKTVKGDIFAFVADSISYSSSRSYEGSKDYLFLSGVDYGAGCQEFVGGIYDPVDWTVLWIPTNKSYLQFNEEQWPVRIGSRIYVLEMEETVDLLRIPHINNEFELEIDLEAK